MTRHQFLKSSLAIASGGITSTVVVRTAQIVRARYQDSADSTPRLNLNHFNNTELLGRYQQVRKPEGFRGDTLVIWMDYACPSCAVVFRQNARAPFSPDKLRVVYRNCPLASHPTAVELAVAVEAADAQEKGDALRDWLFKNLGYGRAGKEYCLKTIGVNRALWLESQDEARVRVMQDKAEAARIGIDGTPTLILLSQEEPRQVFASELAAYHLAS